MGFTNQIKVTAGLLNCRFQPSMSARILGTIAKDEVHNIVTEQNGWGQLENGSWINLNFTVPIKHEETIEIPEVVETEDVVAVAPEVPEVPEEAVAQTVEVPVAEVAMPVVEPKTTTKTVFYKVKDKESLWDIAELHYGKGNGDRYAEIKKANKLKSDILRAGMVLKIPNVEV